MRYNLFLLVTGTCASTFTTLAQAQTVQAQTFSASQRPKIADGYTRYAVPSQCVAAVRRETVASWRGATFTDTMTYTAVLKHELIPPSAVRAAQQCVTRMQTVARQPVQDVAMIELAVLAEREDIKTRFLDSVVARVAAEHESDPKAWLFKQLIEVFPGGRWSAFEPLRYPAPLARLLSLVSCEDWTLCRARMELLFLLRRDARARGDFSAAAALSDSLITVQHHSSQYSSFQREETGRLHAYPRADIFWSFARWHDDTTLATGAPGVQPAWERVRKGLVDIGDDPDNPLLGFAEGNRHYLFMDSLMRRGTPVKFPTLTPTAWVGRTGVASAPASGRVLLIIDQARVLDYNPLVPMVKFPTVTAMARRLHTKYAASGFDIVWVVESRGHFKGSSVLSFAEEQKALAAYWFDYHKVPGIIALDQTTFTKRQDNRLVSHKTSAGAAGVLARLNARAGGNSMMGGMYLVDRNGNLITPVMRMDRTRDAEPALERLIERALGKRAN